jgi:hypothetical protein
LIPCICSPALICTLSMMLMTWPVSSGKRLRSSGGDLGGSNEARLRISDTRASMCCIDLDGEGKEKHQARHRREGQEKIKKKT